MSASCISLLSKMNMFGTSVALHEGNFILMPVVMDDVHTVRKISILRAAVPKAWF